MLNPDRAYTIAAEKGLSFDDEFFIFSGGANPWTVDSGVATGSWYIKTNGSLFLKTGSGTDEADWTVQSFTGGADLLSISSSSSSVTVPSVDVLVLTPGSGTIDVTLPASPVTGTHVHIKLRGPGDARILGGTYEIDGESEVVLRTNETSLHLTFLGNEWIII